MQCNFCGSKEILVETGLDVLDSWTEDGPQYVKERKFCCKAQAQNAEYRNKFVPGHEPSIEETEKW